MGKRNKQAILRHKEALTIIAKEADNLKREVEQAKLMNEESGDEVAKWALEVEEKIDEADHDIETISKLLREMGEEKRRDRDVRAN